MRMSDIYEVINQLDLLVENIKNDINFTEEEKLFLLSSINYNDFMSLINTESIDFMSYINFNKQKNDEFLSLLESKDKSLNDFLNQTKANYTENRKNKNRSFFNGEFYYADTCFNKPRLFIEKMNQKIEELGEKGKILKIGVKNYIYLKKEIGMDLFLKDFKDYTDVVIENIEMVNLNNTNKHIFSAKKIIFSHDFKYNTLINKFVICDLYTLKISKTLKEEFDIAKNFTERYIEKIKDLVIEYVKTNECYNRDYLINGLIKSILSKYDGFGFKKLEKKLLKDNGEISNEDKEYILEGLYSLLNERENKPKDITSFYIKEDNIYKNNEINVLTKLEFSEKTGVNFIFQNKIIEKDVFNIILKKFNPEILLIKIVDNTEDLYIMKSKEMIAEMIAAEIKILIKDIKKITKSIVNIKKVVDERMNIFYGEIDRNIRAAKLNHVLKEKENVSSRKKI